jgi:hypothetical protein
VIDFSAEWENAKESICLRQQFVSKEIEDKDWQNEKYSEQKAVMLREMKTECSSDCHNACESISVTGSESPERASKTSERTKNGDEIEWHPITEALFP